MCNYFVRCDRTPAFLVKHPVLEWVEACPRCMRQVGLEFEEPTNQILQRPRWDDPLDQDEASAFAYISWRLTGEPHMAYLGYDDDGVQRWFVTRARQAPASASRSILVGSVTDPDPTPLPLSYDGACEIAQAGVNLTGEDCAVVRSLTGGFEVMTLVEANLECPDRVVLKVRA